MKNVYIVTNPELGWDCICAVYYSGKVLLAEIQKEWPERTGFIVHQFPVEEFIEKE